MKSRVLKSLSCLVLAAAAAAAWDLHLLGAHHEAAEDCQVCAVASAPELNADCGSELIADPGSFFLVDAEVPEPKAGTAFRAAFCGRAPPAA